MTGSILRGKLLPDSVLRQSGYEVGDDGVAVEVFPEDDRTLVVEPFNPLLIDEGRGRNGSRSSPFGILHDCHCGHVEQRAHQFGHVVEQVHRIVSEAGEHAAVTALNRLLDLGAYAGEILVNIFTAHFHEGCTDVRSAADRGDLERDLAVQDIVDGGDVVDEIIFTGLRIIGSEPDQTDALGN